MGTGGLRPLPEPENAGERNIITCSSRWQRDWWFVDQEDNAAQSRSDVDKREPGMVLHTQFLEALAGGERSHCRWGCGRDGAVVTAWHSSVEGE